MYINKGAQVTLPTLMKLGLKYNIVATIVHSNPPQEIKVIKGRMLVSTTKNDKTTFKPASISTNWFRRSFIIKEGTLINDKRSKTTQSRNWE